jgi:hypothetical protein
MAHFLLNLTIGINSPVNKKSFRKMSQSNDEKLNLNETKKSDDKIKIPINKTQTLNTNINNTQQNVNTFQNINTIPPNYINQIMLQQAFNRNNMKNVEILNKAFNKNPKPSFEEINEIVKQTNLSKETVNKKLK